MTKIGFATAALGALLGSTGAIAQNAANEGDPIAYSFQDALVNGQGVKSLADLQGRPVMVEFWGNH